MNFTKFFTELMTVFKDSSCNNMLRLRRIVVDILVCFSVEKSSYPSSVIGFESTTVLRHTKNSSTWYDRTIFYSSSNVVIRHREKVSRVGVKREEKNCGLLVL
jgi:hypothetical protein